MRQKRQGPDHDGLPQDLTDTDVPGHHRLDIKTGGLRQFPLEPQLQRPHRQQDPQVVGKQPFLPGSLGLIVLQFLPEQLRVGPADIGVGHRRAQRVVGHPGRRRLALVTNLRQGAKRKGLKILQRHGDIVLGL